MMVDHRFPTHDALCRCRRCKTDVSPREAQLIRRVRVASFLLGALIFFIVASRPEF